MGRTLVLGDIHGAAKALKQVLVRSEFDYAEDSLIFLGDVADGWPETRQAIDILLDIENLTHLLGNHDEWFADWVETGRREFMWVSQGGQATIDSYGSILTDVPDRHREYLRGAKSWYELITPEARRIFVHGGWPFGLYDHPEEASSDILSWDRSLWSHAMRKQVYGTPGQLTDFDEVYIGHTSTWAMSMTPMQACEVWNLDQGAGWEGKLSLMDIDTKEYWQSDIVAGLYPDAPGRF